MIYAGTNGFVDHLPESALQKYETELFRFVETNQPDLLSDLRTERELTDDIKSRIESALKDFNETFTA
jgi:F-type H+-transporting ATPase subunit alpha